MDYFMEWAEWLEIVDNFPKDDKVALDKIDTELEELEKDIVWKQSTKN